MKRLSPMLLATLVLTGCHAPMPSFNLLAPYGPTRIPPAATGSGAPSTYYQPSQQSSSTTPVGTGFRAQQASTSLSADAATDRYGVRTASVLSDSGQTARATLETTSVVLPRSVPTTLVSAGDVVQPRGQLQAVDSAELRNLPANVRGMRVNDATVEPARFFPTLQVVDITQLPPASSIQYANVVPVNQAVGTSVAQAATSSRLSSRSSTGGGGWQPRD